MGPRGRRIAAVASVAAIVLLLASAQGTSSLSGSSTTSGQTMVLLTSTRTGPVVQAASAL